MYTKDELAKRRNTLSTEKLALLHKRIQHKAGQEVSARTIPLHVPSINIPLSFAQQRLWFLQQFDPENAAYNEMISLRLVNPLNYEEVNQTIRSIVQRHEVMRTIFPFTADGPIQVIQSMEDLDIVVPLIDLQSLSYEEREAAARQWTEADMQCSFHLTEQLPWRIHLLQLERDVHVLVITMHHIVTDAWSLEIFVKELIALYQASCHNTPSSLPDLPIQYADYACWQHQWLASRSLEKQISYWQQQLADPLPVLELPFDRPRSDILTHHGRRSNWSMPAQLYQAIHQFSQQEGTTPFMLLLAAFKVLLYRYTLQEDIIVGSPVAGRLHIELEPLLGCFVNTLVFRTNLEGNPGFRELLQRVRHVALAAYEHQDVPFEKLVQVLQPERSTGRNPIFQTMFVLQNVPQAQAQTLDLIVTPFEITINTTRFDLSIVLQEASHVLGGYVEYNTDLFNDDTIERLLGHYQTLLEQIIAHPDTPIAELSLHSSWDTEIGMSPCVRPCPDERCSW
nr:non-ribosomal peptide synthetase [Ktedonobacteraceae bacterium]